MEPLKRGPTENSNVESYLKHFISLMFILSLLTILMVIMYGILFK
uniref:Uncharacterized protein n=1 Tax=Anguilla anguilla TaxID=7936 RepID=A0A0E9SYR8_ANGAN